MMEQMHEKAQLEKKRKNRSALQYSPEPCEQLRVDFEKSLLLKFIWGGGGGTWIQSFCFERSPNKDPSYEILQQRSFFPPKI